MQINRCYRIAIAIATICLLGSAAAQSEDFERPAAVSAYEWWNGTPWLSTKLWRVRDEVRCHSLTNYYVIDSIYGTFDAWGDQQLLRRLHEIQVINTLRGEGVTEAGEEGVNSAAEKKIRVIENLATKPVATVFDVPRGAGAILRRAGSLTREERRKGNYGGEGLVKGWLGATDRKREIAAEFGIDPYSDNEALQDELDRVAALESLPDFAIGLLIPDKGLFSALEAAEESRIRDAYLASPSDLFTRNRKTLIEALGVGKDLAAAFLSLEFATPAQQTILVESLTQLEEAKGHSTLVELAAATDSRSEFDFYRRNAELLAWYQRHVESIVEIEEFWLQPLAIDAQGRRIMPLAVDLAGWYSDSGSFLSQFAAVGTGDVVLLSGRLTERAQAELEKRSVRVIFVSELEE